MWPTRPRTRPVPFTQVSGDFRELLGDVCFLVRIGRDVVHSGVRNGGFAFSGTPSGCTSFQRGVLTAKRTSFLRHVGAMPLEVQRAIRLIGPLSQHPRQQIDAVEGHMGGSRDPRRRQQRGDEVDVGREDIGRGPRLELRRPAHKASRADAAIINGSFAAAQTTL